MEIAEVHRPRGVTVILGATEMATRDREDGLLNLSEAIAAEPRLADAKLTQEPRRVYWLDREGPADTLVLTHPSTSTEFLIRWEPESRHRLAVLPGGRARQLMLDQREGMAGWTESYRNYFEDELNGRAVPFRDRGSFNPELTQPFYKVYGVEEAGLHPIGHDDQGEIRTDGHSGLSLPLFAGTPTEEVVEWLVTCFERLDRVVAPSLPDWLSIEKAALAAWPQRVQLAQSVVRDASWLRVNAQGHVVEEAIRRLQPDRLFLTFPRDRRGRLAPRVRVLLSPTEKGLDAKRRPWIVACGPRRVGGVGVTVQVEKLIAVNQTHRFDLTPWRWQRDSAPLTEPSTWDGQPSTDAIGLLRGGRVEEGLRAAGLRLDEGVTRLAKGLVLSLGYENPTWPVAARDCLCRVFPPLLLGAGLKYARQILRRADDAIIMCSLPGQRQARRGSIVFVPDEPPRLELRWTGSNRRLPWTVWERPPTPGVWSAE